jgi:hypothetical protein
MPDASPAQDRFGWVDELLSDTRSVVHELLDEPLLPLASLDRAVGEYRQAIEDARSADQELGLALVEGASALLTSAICADTHRLVQVAVRYFVMDDDGDDDLASPFGFDDDVEVFNAVATVLGRDELVIPML